MNNTLGKVYLVGAGPGDPGLLTLKGKECLELADVVIADYLANPVLLGYTRPGVESVQLGRRGTPEYLSQEAITTLMITRARAGQQVVRLKNGDPFLFGRGGEEAAALAANGILFEIVPGVSSAIACPAYLGIPVTHRHYASQVTIVTGHEDPSQPESDIGWAALARQGGTLVIVMGLRTFPSILASLLAHGKPPTTPIALISNGTLPTQRAIIGTLGEIEAQFAEAALEPPVTAIIGEVVRLHPHLRWGNNGSPLESEMPVPPEFPAPFRR